MSSSARSFSTLVLAWCAALAVATALLIATHFRTRDPDSALYVIIASRLAEQPASTWIAPQWWGGWKNEGPFREHPAGAFVGPAALTRLGIPGEEASFVVNLVTQVVTLLVVVALAARLLPPATARLPLWTLQLLPIAFVFRIRANHEYPVDGRNLRRRLRYREADAYRWFPSSRMAASLHALREGDLRRSQAGSHRLAARRAAGRARREHSGLDRDRTAGHRHTGQRSGCEHAYVAATGPSFFDYYLGVQLRRGRLQPATRFPINKAWNAIWYIGRVIWHAAPWSVSRDGEVTTRILISRARVAALLSRRCAHYRAAARAE